MATISNTLKLQDSMSRPMLAINKAMGSTLAAIRSIKGAELGPEFAQAAADIKLAEQAVKNMNLEIQETPSATQKVGDGFTVMKGLAVHALAAIGRAAKNAVGDVITLTDDITSSAARLNLIAGEGETVAGIQQSIFQAAQRSRGEYLGMVDSVAKIRLLTGDAFSSTKEAVFFTEQLNKQFAIVGTNAADAKSTMRQITQALGSGRLQGDEFVSVIENASLYAQQIAEYMGIPYKELKAMASEGVITADILKGALFAAAEETNARFAAMPMTISQMTRHAANAMLQAFTPAIQTIGEGARWVYDNWDDVAPVLAGVTGSILAAAAAWGIYTAAQWIATGAAAVFFATLLASPIGWIALLVGAVVYEIYKWVKAVGGIKIAWAVAVDSVLSGVGNMKVGVLTGIENMVNGAIGLLNQFTRWVNKTFGTELSIIGPITLGAAEAASSIAWEQRLRSQNIDRMQYNAAVKEAVREKDMAQGFDLSDYTANTPGGKALKTSNTEPLKLDNEDMKMLLDIATRDFQLHYQTLTPTINVNVGTVRETADVNQIIEIIADEVEELAGASLAYAP